LNYYVSSTLDILIKREFLLRKLISFNNNLLDLPKSFLASPRNPIIMDIRSDLIENSYVELKTENLKNKSLKFITKLNSRSTFLENSVTNKFKTFVKHALHS